LLGRWTLHGKVWEPFSLGALEPKWLR
jgi:hypothetical protein